MIVENNAQGRNLRRHVRFPTKIPATVKGNFLSIPVNIRDISQRGALIDIARPLPCGYRVRISAEGLDVQGAVIWTSNTQCGIYFDEVIDPLEVVRSNASHMQTLASPK